MACGLAAASTVLTPLSFPSSVGYALSDPGRLGWVVGFFLFIRLIDFRSEHMRAHTRACGGGEREREDLQADALLNAESEVGLYSRTLRS